MAKVKIEKTRVYGFEPSLRGLRNPMNSWDKSDSFQFIYCDGDAYSLKTLNKIKYPLNYQANEEGFVLGESDKPLAQKLTKAGSEHSKFLRQIHVWADFIFPRYWWSEMDTYHYNTKNSTSTMHKLMSRDLVLDDFIFNRDDVYVINFIIGEINDLRFRHSESDDIIEKHELLRRAKQLLPEGYLQMRTMDTNYAELLNIYKQRWNHKLKLEWQDTFCKWVEELPYFVELTGIERKFTK